MGVCALAIPVVWAHTGHDLTKANPVASDNLHKHPLKGDSPPLPQLVKPEVVIYLGFYLYLQLGGVFG